MTDREQLLDELRPLAFNVAYRMLGSVFEAEDIAHLALFLGSPLARYVSGQAISVDGNVEYL